MSSPDDIRSEVEVLLRRSGLDDTLTVTRFESLRDAITRRFVPDVGVGETDWMPEDSPEQIVIKRVAEMIRTTAIDAPKMNIDPVARAYNALVSLDAWNLMLAAIDSSQRPKAEPGRTRRLLEKNRIERRARR